MNSVVKWFGGKNSMFKNIISEFPQCGSYDTYIEPFGGSYGVGFHTPDELIVPIEIYNDLYNNVYCLFKVLSDKNLFIRFRELCNCSYYDEYMRQLFKEELKNNDLDELTRAFYFFYVNRTSHNGIGGFSMNRVVRRGMPKSVSDYMSTVDRLSEIHERLSKVMVLCRDGIGLMEDYNSPNVFIYCDPPYVLSTRSSAERYVVDMTDKEHERFIDVCLNSKAKLLISGYDNELYNRLTDNGFKKLQFEVNTISGDRKPKTKIETLWKNYKI